MRSAHEESRNLIEWLKLSAPLLARDNRLNTPTNIHPIDTIQLPASLNRTLT
jgi:hypothetical protein